MSYFSQGENTTVSATKAEAVTAMMADVIAIQDLYGAAGAGSLTDGATTYGVGHTLGASWLGQLFDAVNGDGYAASYDGSDFALTISDIGGHDLLDLSNDTFAQNVYLGDEGISDVMGLTGNLIIARGTEIEDYNAGSGNDTVRGNGAANTISGNDGNDTLKGFNGKDVLSGGNGDDTLKGGAGRDFLKGGAGADVLNGGTGIDIADYSGASAGVTVDLGNVSANTGDAFGDTFAFVELLRHAGRADEAASIAAQLAEMDYGEFGDETAATAFIRMMQGDYEEALGLFIENARNGRPSVGFTGVRKSFFALRQFPEYATLEKLVDEWQEEQRALYDELTAARTSSADAAHP